MNDNDRSKEDLISELNYLRQRNLELETCSMEKHPVKSPSSIIDNEANPHKIDVLESISDCFYALDKDLRFIYANKAAEEIWGLSRTDLIGHKIEDVFTGLIDISLLKFRQVLEEQIPLHYEVYSKVIKRWGDMSVYPIREGITVYFRDATERKKMEEALGLSEEMFAKAFEHNAAGMSIVRLKDGKYIGVNNAWLSMFGYRHEDVLGHTSLKLNLWPHRHERDAMYEALRTKGYVRELELSLKKQSGESRVGLVSADVITMNGEEVILASILDITDRKRAEEALRESEKKYRTLIETAGEGVAIAKPNGPFFYINRRMADMLGYSEDEILGKSALDFCCDDWKPQVLQIRQELHKGKILNGEFKFRRKDGSVLWSMYNASPIYDDNGENTATFAMHTDITERKRTEEALAIERKRLFDVMETLPVTICLISTDHHVVFANKLFREKFGELDDRHCYEYCCGYIEPCSFCEAFVPIKTGQMHNWEFVHPKSNTVYDVYSLPFTDTDGSTLILEMDFDITERNRAKEELRQLEERFHRIFSNNLIPMATWKKNGEIVDANEALLDLIGYTHDELGDNSICWTELTSSEYAERDLQAIAEVNEKGFCTPYEKYFKHKEGHLIPILICGQKFDDDLKVGVFFAIDLTERKRMEKERERLLKEVEEQSARLQAVLQVLPVGVWVADAGGKMILANQAAATIYGGKAPELSEIKEYGVYQIWRPETGKSIEVEDYPLVRALRGKTVNEVELNHQRFDGSRGTHLASAVPIRDSKGVLLGGVVVAMDITERKRDEELLRESKERQAFLLKLSDALRPLSDPIEIQGTVTRTAMDYFGADRCYYCEIEDDNAIIRRDASLGGLPSVVGVYPLSVLPIHKSFIDAGQPFIVPDVYTTEMVDEELRQLCIQLKVISYLDVPVVKDGKPVGILCIVQSSPRDWTDSEAELAIEVAERTWAAVEQARTKEALLKAEYDKNEALRKAIEMKDEFISLISHEFKTPITVINSAVQAMRLICKNELSDKANGFLGKILQNSNRQLKLVNNLLDISRMNAGHLQIRKSNRDVVSITKSITESIRIFADHKGISLSFSSTMQKKVMGIDEEKYERILLNLLSNAIKFTPKGKSVTVKVSQRIIDRRYKVCIEVRDKGIGIPKDKQQLIFERFGQVDNLLSRQAEGTGIGLALVKMFVELLDGEITLKSEEGKGSTFSVLFPVGKVKETPLEKMAQDISDDRLIQATAMEFSDINY